MKNTEVFSPAFGYDMVVAVTQGSINDQLAHLANPDIGVIKTKFILGLKRNAQKQYEPVFYDSWQQVPKNADDPSIPASPVVDSDYLPSISVSSSGTMASLVMNFRQGTAWFVDPIDNSLVNYDMSGWKYGIAIQLDFAGISREQIDAGLPVPTSVLEKLQNFNSNGFDISHLFMDFTNTDLVRFDPDITYVGNAGDDAKNVFAIFMTNYLKGLKASSKNPYILGYAITQPGEIQDPDKNVPDSLKPVGQTFTVYKDPVSDSRSNINFILNTKGGQNSTPGTHPTPGNFDSNWLSPSDECDAKMIYSDFCLLETLILKPFYVSYGGSVRKTMEDAGIIVPPVPPYDQGVTNFPFGKTMRFAEVTQGDNQYTNIVTVEIKLVDGGVNLEFNGRIYAKKQASKDMRVCTAEAWAWSEIIWKSRITIAASKNDKGEPVLTASPPKPEIVRASSDKGMNDCAKAWSIIGQILGTFLDIISLGLTDGFFENLFNDLLSTSVPGIPSPTDAFQNMSSTINTSFLLPAGNVFFFEDVLSDLDGNTSLNLTYKAATFAFDRVTESALIERGKSNYKFSHNPYSMVAIPRKPKKAKHVTQPKLESILNLPTNQIDPLAQPLTDTFSVPLLEQADGECDVSVSCELMTSTSAATPLSANSDFKVIENAKGQSSIFSIGTDQKLSLLQADSGTTSTGYSTIDLMDGFPGYSSAVAFDVSQDLSGDVSLAVALRGNSGDVIDVFFFEKFARELSASSVYKLSSSATKVGGIDPKFVTEQLRLGTSDDTRRAPLVISGKLGADRFFYQLEAGNSSATKMKFPENLNPNQEQLLSIDMGFEFGQRANYFLYNIGPTKSLVAITIPDEFSGSLVYDYSPGNPKLPDSFRNLKYNNIATSTARSGSQYSSSDLYITANTGVYRIPRGKAGAMEQVTDAIVDAHEIIVASTSDSVALWVFASPNFLYYIAGKKLDDNGRMAWNKPIQFASNVVHVAPTKRNGSNANELFTLNQDSSITHYWQDPNTNNWLSKTAAIKGSNFVVNADSYTCQVQFSSKNIPLAGSKVSVTSSEWQYCLVNGLMYSLDIDVPAEVELDFQGNINIICTAVDMAPPVLHIQSSLFEETLNIYPSGKQHRHIRDIASGSGIQSATTQDGKPVMDPSTLPDTAQAIADNISKLNKAPGVEFPPSVAGNVFTVVESPGSSLRNIKHSMQDKLDFSSGSHGFISGMIVQGGKWQRHSKKTAAAHVRQLQNKGLIEDFSSIMGDIWHFLKASGKKIVTILEDGVVKLVDGVSFVLHEISEGLEFILTLADQAIRLVLKGIGEVLRAITWILSLVGIDIRKILAWIGHLLGWDHIWATHQMIAKSSKLFLDFAETKASKYIEIVRGEAATFFENAGTRVRQTILPNDLANNPPTREISNPEAEKYSKLVKSPQGSYATNLLSNIPIPQTPLVSNGLPINGARFEADSFADDPLMQFYDDVLKPAAEEIATTLKKDGNDLLKLLEDTSFSNLRILFADVADGLVKVVAKVVDGFLKFTLDLIKDLVDAMSEPFDLPIIGALWDFITELFGGEKEDLTVLNAASLVVSILSTTICKLATGQTPDQFDDGFTVSGFPDRVEEYFKPAVSSKMLRPQSETQNKKAQILSDNGATSASMLHFSHAQSFISPSASIVAGILDLLSNKDLKGSPLTQNGILLGKIGAGINIFKLIFSWPCPKDGEPQDGYTMRWIAWAISALGTFLSAAKKFFDKIPDKIVDAFKLLTSAITLIMAFIIDGIENASLSSWISDLGSNTGGTLQAVSAFLPPGPAKAGTKGAGLAVAFALGNGIAFAKGAAVLAQNEVAQLINPGGIT